MESGCKLRTLRLLVDLNCTTYGVNISIRDMADNPHVMHSTPPMMGTSTTVQIERIASYCKLGVSARTLMLLTTLHKIQGKFVTKFITIYCCQTGTLTTAQTVRVGGSSYCKLGDISIL
jgi:hypothetical protein